MTVSSTSVSNLLRMASMGMTHLTELVSVTNGSIEHGHCRGTFTDDADVTHVIILHELKSSRVWVFDRSENRFV